VHSGGLIGGYPEDEGSVVLETLTTTHESTTCHNHEVQNPNSYRRENSDIIYEGESNENRKIFFKFNLLNESGTQLYHFST
jgi:hypothetical protein